MMIALHGVKPLAQQRRQLQRQVVGRVQYRRVEHAAAIVESDWANIEQRFQAGDMEQVVVRVLPLIRNEIGPSNGMRSLQRRIDFAPGDRALTVP